MWETVRKARGALMLAMAVTWNIWTIMSLAGGAAAERQRHTDMPLGAVAALVVYVAEASSVGTGVWFCSRLGRKPPHIVRDVWDRFLWVALAMAFVPLTTFLAGGLGLALGPPGWVIGGVYGGAIPYLVVDRLL